MHRKEAKRRTSDPSLHRDGFGEIPRRVDLSLEENAEVVGKKLQDIGEEEALREQVRGERNRDDIDASVAEIFVPFGREDHDLALPSTHILDRSHEPVVTRIVFLLRGEHEDGRLVGHERERSMLETAGRKRRRRTVDDLFELERAFRSDGDVASERENLERGGRTRRSAIPMRPPCRSRTRSSWDAS